jgi:hypothetical protein
MSSNRPMPISPMPGGDLTPAMLAYEQGTDGQKGVGMRSRPWIGILGRAGPQLRIYLMETEGET